MNPLTIYNLAVPIPNIALALQPVPVSCSAWEELNASIMNYPVVAGGVLALGFFLLWRRG